MGLLIVRGVLKVKQFWPGGRSDADTANVELVKKDPFVFVNGAGHRAPTKVFDNAESLGKQRSAVVKAPKSGPRHVTIRLQGIDAPELHFQPQVKGHTGVTHPFRQAMGETSADALHRFLTSFGMAAIPCEVVTKVEKPSDVCDAYGRIVGNIQLTMDGSRIDINQWLLREGWAVPGLYNSMSTAEILAVLADSQAAKQHKRGLYSKQTILARKLAKFDPNRRERKGPSSFKPFSDQGPVNFPKFFRRQADLYVRLTIGENLPTSLKAYIATKKDDLALKREHLLKLHPPVVGNAAKKKFKLLASFLGANDFPTGPELVYFESDSKLVKAGTNTEIKKF